MRRVYKLSLLINMALLLVLMPAPKPAYAQWPPIDFELNLSSYQNGRITYRIVFGNRAKWLMTHLTFKIPLPQGTRFVEADTQPGTVVEFDGVEVTFYTASLQPRNIRVATLVVEVTDQTAVFTTHAWLSWQGNLPGDYLTKDVTIDISRKTLDWDGPPSPPRLQLDTTATVADGTITYAIYPMNVSQSRRVRMQDVKIKVLLPEGTTLRSAEPALPFEANFDGREVTFSALELAWGTNVEPLKVNILAQEATEPFVALHAWATWKNVSRQVGRSIAAQEETQTTDILIQPHIPQWTLTDTTGDVPSFIDVSSLALVNDGQAVNMIFQIMQPSRPDDTPLTYHFLIDSDCLASTGGKTLGHRGEEYWIKYKDHRSQAIVDYWDEEAEDWLPVGWIPVNNPPGGKLITMHLPYDMLNGTRQFCWLAEVWYAGPETFIVPPPIERVPDSGHPEFRQFDAETMLPAAPYEVFVTENSIAQPSDGGTLINVGDTWRYLPGWSEPPSTWKNIDFDDGDWYSGPTSIGYGRGKYATDLSRITQPVQPGDAPILAQRIDKESGMILAMLPTGYDGSVYMRRTFTVVNPAQLTRLVLNIEYEGGFVAYLNGVEVGRRGLGRAGLPVTYDTLATDQEAGGSESIDLSDYITTLVGGTNVLAIQGHKSANVSKLTITPKLTWESEPTEVLANTTGLDEFSTDASVSPSAPTMTDINGKLAIPLDNGQVAYDLHVYSLPDGQELVTILNARQPNFRFDGQRLLINREGGGQENVFEYNFVDGTQRQVSDAPRDAHPFYDPWGNRVVYGNSELTVGAGYFKENPDNYVNRYPYIFVQCGLLPPHLESEQRCQDIPRFGILVPAGQTGEIRGSHPVWTTNDMIVYNGCNSWAGFGACGIYIVPSSSTKGFSDGFIPRQLSQDTSDIPSDTKGGLIAFTSHRDGNWEAYVMDLNGVGVRNVSNSPDSNDGLPTISPVGNWVAFVSDRSGQWAVWVVPVVGGPTQKLFDLAADTPWGDGDRSWTNERISWGP